MVGLVFMDVVGVPSCALVSLSTSSHTCLFRLRIQAHRLFGRGFSRLCH